MMRFLPVAVTVILVLVGVALSLTVGGGGKPVVQDSEVIVGEGVEEALQQAQRVEVFISLKEGAYDQGRKTTARDRQLRILAALTEEDFELLNDFDGASALSGWLTSSGLEKLRVHPDVAAVALDLGYKPGQSVFVGPEVGEALQEQYSVKVLIGLRGSGSPITELRRLSTSDSQARVLAELTDDDFVLIRKFEISAALGGYVTRAGLEKLVVHPDVVSIGLSCCGSVGEVYPITPEG